MDTTPDTATALRRDREQLFALLARPETGPEFFHRVADDVDWTVEGTSPIAGRYTGKQVFFDETFGRIGPLLREGPRMQLQRLFVDGATVVAELRTASTTLEGAPYDYALCWVCRFDSAEPGATLVEVRAYLDTAMVTWVILRNERLRSAAPTR